MSLRRVDLNLFRAFEAVLKHGSIVAASRALSVTPSAVSHAIARLREALDDPLFVPTDQGMRPTPRAMELAPHVQGGLERIDFALRSRKFSPDSAVRTFRVAMSDYSAGVVLAPLMQRLQSLAPNIDLRIFPFDNVDTIRQVEDGRLDMVIGWFMDISPQLCRRMLWKDIESIIVRNGHPLTQREVTRESLLEYPHVVVELTGTGDSYDDGYVEERGVVMRVWLERLLLDTRNEGDQIVGRAAVSVPHYASVIPIVASTNMVATLPASYAMQAVKQGIVQYLPLPYEPIVGHLEAVWHQRSESDEALQWLIGQARDAAAETRCATNAPSID